MKNALLCSLLLSLSGAALAAPCTERARTPWPTVDWSEELVDPVAKAAPLKALEDYLFTLTGTDAERKGLRTDGLVIIHNGALVYERYARGFDATKRHISWSVAKSVSSTLIGVAVQQGALTLEDSICDHLPGAPASACEIQVKHLLTFGSGLHWQEAYEHSGYQASSVISMLFGEGHRDQVGFALGHKVDAAPGSKFVYSTGEAHVLATVARNALAKAHGKDAFWTLLFEKIGMKRVVMEEDPKGGVLGGAFLYATPRDYAKLGYLMQNDGCWDGQRVLPEGWVQAATTPSPTFLADPKGKSTPAGYMWWLNRPIPEHGIEKPWKDAPEDTFVADGHWGQYIIVIPSQGLVIVRTGDDRAADAPQNELIKRVMEVVR